MKKFKEKKMHIDESKKFDKRNIERNIKNGIIIQKDYEIYLYKLPDVSDKVFNIEGSLIDNMEFDKRKENDIQTKKRGLKKKATKGKVK